MKKIKFRASFSVLSCWARGDWEEAVRMYFRLPRRITPSMIIGREYHQVWQHFISVHQALPPEFGGRRLNRPACEAKLTVPLYDWLDLTGVIDCYDRPVIYEFKTGKNSSVHHSGNFQVEVYGVLATLAGWYVDRAEVHRYDPQYRKADMTLVWLTDKALRRGMNWIETIASEMYLFCLQNGLFKRWGNLSGGPLGSSPETGGGIDSTGGKA